MRVARVLAGLLGGALAAVAGAQPTQPTVELVESAGQPPEVRICGIASENIGDGFAIYAAEEGAGVDAAAVAQLPPLWGDYSYRRGCTTFLPRHQPAAGMELVVFYRGQLLSRLALAPAEAKTRVEEIYPSGEEIPENLLRLYVTFSGPMSLKGVEQHVHLFDGAGKEIESAFVAVPEGLWDPGRRRLTLLLHPGRVKSGIAVGEELGPVLRKGEEVRLGVDEGARDQDGAPLAAGGRRSWKIGAPQKEPIAAAQFRLTAENGPLEIASAVALDRALAIEAFTVLKEDRELPGEWQLDPGERRLVFLPAEPWQRGETYRVRIAAQLEDVAGNRPGRAFETPTGAADEAGALELSFVP